MKIQYEHSNDCYFSDLRDGALFTYSLEEDCVFMKVMEIPGAEGSNFGIINAVNLTHAEHAEFNDCDTVYRLDGFLTIRS